MTPEERARLKIDKKLEAAGWRVVSRAEFVSDEAVAVTEGLLEGNDEADYLLFLMGKAVGVVEAKREETDVNTPKVIAQAEGYTHKLPAWCAAWQNPLPLVWLSNGKQYFFRDLRDTDQTEYTEVERFLSPKEVVKLLQIPDRYAGLPLIQKRGLRDCQYEGIYNLEQSLKAGKERALMVLATGAGKTYLAITMAYRLLNYAQYHRVLFLVDRNNLGRQAEREFGSYRLTESGDPFNTIFGVDRLKSGQIDPGANVVISTIQRLFSLLSGEPVTDNNEDDETPLDDDDERDNTPAVILPGTPQLPRDYFDLIIIDECHRSIYSSWRAVLDYFGNAVKVGLTATPAPQTLAYFEQNRVVNYTLEKSILDHVNVGYRTYRIKTEVTENGGAIREGDKTKQETVYTGKTEEVVSTDTTQYTKEELNRSIINPSQIKLILQTYKDAVYTEMFTDPQREADFNYLPKTLIFALNDRHADNIVRIAEEVFGREHSDGFVQKITYSAGNTDQLIKDFCNEKRFRIAVTVTLVATGIDIKPLEVVMFMRYVKSQLLYEQMKGRGVRTIGDDVLRNVTPNAFSKDLFFLVDAVGVTEGEHTIPQPQGGQPPVPSLEKLLEMIVHGDVSDDNLWLLSQRISRINARYEDKERDKFCALAGISMEKLALRIAQAVLPGEGNITLPPYTDINQPNTERKALVQEIVQHTAARNYLLELNKGYINTLQPGEDTLISKGFTIEEAQQTVDAFEQYVQTHKDETEALQIIYSGNPLNREMLEELVATLQNANAQFEPHRLWNSYALVQPDNVKHFKNDEREQRNLLTNIIQLVRFAYKQINRLDTLSATANQYFNLWCGQAQRSLTQAQTDIFRHIKDYIVANGSCDIDEYMELDGDCESEAAFLLQTVGRGALREHLNTLAKFIVYQRTA